jgi:hypothetical protein
MRLELCFSVLAGTKILEQFLQRHAKRFVLGILVELIAQEFELVEDSIGVVPVAFSQKEMSLVVKAVPLVGRGVLENVALLLEASAHELVKIFEPVSELGIPIGVAIDVVNGFEKIVGTRRVGEALNEGLELCQRCFIIADSA